MKQEKFATKWGFVLAAAGSAIGLGNVWRFPYLVGQHGGFAFIFIYILMVAFICMPLMIAEISVGRLSRSNMIDAYKSINQRSGAKHSSVWTFFAGWLGALGIVMITSFYFLVAGWVIYYLVQALTGSLMQSSSREIEQVFTGLTQSFTQQAFYALLFLCVTAMVVLGGVKKGIERVSLILMPLLFLIFIVLAIQSLMLPGAEKGFDFLFKADWGAIGFTSNGFDIHQFAKVCLAALGQAFISLSLGFGTLLVYGSYMSEKENIFKSVGNIAVCDTLVGILSAMIIIPAIFSAGLEPSSGPGLTFISLPIVFGTINGGYFWGIVFYLLLILATITSTISLFECIVNLFISKFYQSRPLATLSASLLCGTGLTLVTLSFSGVVDIRILGRDLFTFFDWLTSTFISAIVSFTVALFVGYQAIKPMQCSILRGTTKRPFLMRYLFITLRIIAPVALGILLSIAAYDQILKPISIKFMIYYEHIIRFILG